MTEPYGTIADDGNLEIDLEEVNKNRTVRSEDVEGEKWIYLRRLKQRGTSAARLS